VRDADRAIARSVARRDTACGAATVAMCAPQDAALSRWLIAWVGDCRIYRVSATRDGGAELLTTDDTYRQLDEVPPPGSRADDPARMVGNGAVDIANVDSVDLARGPMLVLCSDGVHKQVTSADIARSLREPGSLERRCARLVELARARGSSDDATVLAVQRTSSRRWRVPPFVVGALIGFAAVALVAWLTAPAALISSLRMMVPL
jgi:serine/threonine protein phosphatase PrpC